MTRLPIRDPDDLPDHYDAVSGLPTEYQEYFIIANRLNPSRVLRSLANNPEIQAFHTNAYLTLWQEATTGLTPRETELVILATGRAFGSEYEWASHTPTALAMGLTESELRSLAAGEFDELDERDAVLARYVTAVATMSVTDELHEEVAEHYDDRTIVGIQVLTGYYTLCAVVIDALGLEGADADDIGGQEPLIRTD